LPKEIKITQSIYKSQKNFYDPVLDNIARSIARNKQSGNPQSSLPTKSLCYFCGNQLPWQPFVFILYFPGFIPNECLGL